MARVEVTGGDVPSLLPPGRRLGLGPALARGELRLRSTDPRAGAHERRDAAQPGLDDALARLRLRADESPLAVVEWDADLRATAWNAAAERVFGWPAEEVLGKDVEALGLVHPAEREAVRAASAELLAGARSSSVTACRNVRRDGRVVHCEWYESARHDPSGQLVSVLSLVLDVTARKRAEGALREGEARFRTMADCAPVMIWMAGPDKRCSWFNAVWLAFTGRTLEQELGNGWGAGVHPDDRARCVEEYESRFERREPFTMDYRLRRADGEYRWVLDTGTPRRDRDGAFLGYIGSCLDIHERKSAEEATRAAGERVAEADRRKGDFLAVLSHELRNPLAAITTAVHLLERAPAGGPATGRALEIIQRQAAQLARMVDDLLDVSRIDHGKVTLRRTVLDVREVVLGVAEDARGGYGRRGLSLRVRAGTEPVWVDADGARLTQIVTNLLANAAKFTPPGGAVDLEVTKAGGACEVRVRDSGVGIEPALLEVIFEPFAQAERTREAARGGIGVGLSIVKSLVELHGGTVRARSDGPGGGAEFLVALPLAHGHPERVASPAAEADATPGLSVLIVEDNPDAGETLAELLALEGHRTRLALDGGAGLAAFTEHAPDVLVCDVGLPDRSGYDVVRALRELPGGRDVFAIALTGYAQPEDVALGQEAGFDAHLAKPPPLEALARLLAAAARRGAGARR